MKTKAFRTMLLILLATGALASAQDPAPDLKSLLREALFEEEATRDLAMAAEGYENLLRTYETQREYAATALYRLAEVRRKQERKAEAVKLYQRFLAEFPGHDPLARLSEENLLALGAEVPPASLQAALLDEERQEIERLRLRLTNSPDLLSAIDSKGWAPLHAAARDGQLKVAEFLIGLGADVNQETDKWGTPLVAAAARGHRAMCEVLLAHDADIDRASPLGEAIVSGHRHVAELLLEKGADPNASQQMKMHWLGSGLNQKRFSVTLLGLAVYRDLPVFVEMLLDGGADPDLAPKGQPAPLLMAIERSRSTMVTRLIAEGANVDAVHQKTALGLAIHEGEWAMVKELMNAGARHDLADTGGFLPIHWAAFRGRLELLKVFEGKGTEVDVRNGDDVTPLRYALGGRHWESALFLLAKGADPEAKIEGTPLLYNVPSEMRVRVMRATKYPEWNKGNAITLCLPEILYSTTLATGDREAPGLAGLLLDWKGAPQTISAPKMDWRSLTIFRKSPREMIDVKIGHGEKLPHLEWGDVIEFTSAEPLTAGTSRVSGEWKIDQGTRRVLESNRSISVTVHMDGQERRLALRGSRKTYDPLRKEAPHLPLEQLVQLFGAGQGAEVRVERSTDGGTFTATVGAHQASFVLENGDAIHVTRADGVLSEDRFQGIVLLSPGQLFGRVYKLRDGRDKPPTLLQLMAWQYAPLGKATIDYLAGQFPSQKPPLWNSKALLPLTYSIPPSLAAVLPFPDWSGLRIRRIAEDGSESVIQVNLQKAIDACDDETTFAEARAWDHQLQAGDIVEVPIRGDWEEQTWTGLKFQTVRLLKKALHRQVIYRNPQGVVFNRAMLYTPSHYHDTPAGYLPVPLEMLREGRVSIPRADRLIESVGASGESVRAVTRDGQELIHGDRIWLEDGDTLQGIPKNIPRPRSTSRTPRSTSRTRIQ